MLVLMFFLSILFSQVDYSDIQQIFNNSCNGCHDNSNPSAGLNLLSYDALFSTAGSNVVIPFNSSQSILYDRIIRNDSNPGDMPPGSNDSLSDLEINLIKDWIDEGAFLEPAGCLDVEAYNCEDSQSGLYIQDIGGIVYDNSCNLCLENNYCDGYYNPNASVNNGVCYYSQAPNGEEITFTVQESLINIDWSDFEPPELANIEYYRVQRCTEDSCVPIGSPPFQIFDTQCTDLYEWTENEQLKYQISVKYEYNPYWGWANGYANLVLPSNCLSGDINDDNLLNVLDVVSMIQLILAENYEACADINGDSLLNVLDVVSLLNIILSDNAK